MTKGAATPTTGSSASHPQRDLERAAAQPYVADTLWRVLHRCDSYASSTNQRAAVTTAFNTFLVGGIILKWQEIVEQYATAQWAAVVAGLLLAVTAVASVLSSWFVLRSVGPYAARRPHLLRGTRADQRRRSVIFFEDVGNYESGDAYLEAIAALDEAGVGADLAAQTRTVARAVAAKFSDMRRATWAIIYVELPAIALLVALKLYLTLQSPR